MNLVASLNKLNNYSVKFDINYNRLNFLLEKFNLPEEEFLKNKTLNQQLNNEIHIISNKISN